MRDLLHGFVPQDQWETYDNHGYYSYDIASLQARVISLNTESCDMHNDYLLTQLSDPNYQL